MRKLIGALFASLVAAVSLPTSASMVLTLDFDTGSGLSTYGPYYEDGFRVYSRVLPARFPHEVIGYYQGHFDIFCGYQGFCGPISGNPTYDGSHWLGTDAGGGCRYFDVAMNVLPNVGSCQGIIRIDRSGELFSALDLVNVISGWTLTSSNGASITGYMPWNGDQTMMLSGAGWEGVSWLDLTVNFGVGAPLGFDNLRLQVPEPALPALVVLGLLCSLAFTRSRKQQPRRSN